MSLSLPSCYFLTRTSTHYQQCVLPSQQETDTHTQPNSTARNAYCRSLYVPSQEGMERDLNVNRYRSGYPVKQQKKKMILG
jgi:hypothetical protein